MATVADSPAITVPETAEPETPVIVALPFTTVDPDALKVPTEPVPGTPVIVVFAVP
jgi:hypothetical protein